MSLISDLGPYLIGGAAIITSAAALRTGKAQARNLDTNSTTQLVDAGIRLGTEREQDVKDLAAAVKGLEQRERDRDRLAVAHERWDLDVTHKLAKVGIRVDDPPPIYLPQTG